MSNLSETLGIDQLFKKYPNEYLNERHELLPEILSYINILIAILTIVFVICANNFVTKERKQEFALDMILGMEKNIFA